MRIIDMWSNVKIRMHMYGGCMCAEIIHSADLRLHVFVCRVHFLCCMRTHAPYISLSIFSHINLKKDVQKRKREREKAKRLPLCHAGVVRAFAVGAHRRDHHVRQWSTLRHLSQELGYRTPNLHQFEQVGFGCVPCFDDAHICWFCYTLIIRCGLHHRKYVLDSLFQSGYGSKLVTPIIGHPLVNVYITMEHHRFN